MPAIRDVTSNYTTATTGTTLSIPVPAVVENDLMVVSLVADTGTATSTWNGGGSWTQLFRRVNTTQHDVWWRIAGASEPADYTFTRSAGETFNGRMITIRDIRTGAPFGATTGSITINVAATAGTFTRTAGGSGSFVTDGFAVGDKFNSTGFTNGGNNTTKTILTVTATVITVTDNSGLVDETGNANEQLNSKIWTDTTQGAAAKYTLPQITTTINNSLILYTVSNSAAGVPSIIEGPVTQLAGEDGTAESGGEGWTFQPTAGSTPSTVTCSNVSTGAGVVATIQIAPPTTGATVIPTYCAADSSIYVDPINGTTAYNSNASLSLTFDTLIGTSINGVTLADATAVAAVTDVGLNSFHSVGQISSVTGTKNWGGATIDLNASNTLTTAAGKNILVHTGPNTPGHIQRFGAAASQKGIAIALLSTTGNWKAWHVHGKGTSFGASRDVPLVINTSNTSGVIQTTGTLDTASLDVFGFAVSGSGVGSTLWQFYSLWVLDTTTICGGIAAEPMNIPGLVNAASNGHERRSVVQQGANQAIVYQPIQIGDGGTNPVYMDLNGTAIEFPRQYSLTNLQINYCSADNVAGITYYAGASDTIKHRNSVISSPSRYHWKLHTSSSTSASYDFSGLSVIGAGTISLARAITLTGVTINDYSTLDMSGLTFTDGSILNMPATNDSITTTSSTVIQNSSINTTTVTAGNRWCSVAYSDLDIFASNTFTGSTTSGHAIRITSAGTVSISGNTFTSYGPAARSFDANTGVNTTTNIITLDATHGYNNGEPCYFQDQGGTAPTGMTDGTLYYVRSESSTTISLYTSSAQAIAGGSPGQVDITATGSGTQYIYSAAAAIYNDSGGAVTINVSNGSTPSIRNSDGSSTTVNNNVTVTITINDTSGNAIPGVEVAIFQDNAARTVILASTPTNATGVVSTSAAASLGAIIIRARQSTNKATFNTGTGVVTGTDVITTDANHKFQTGDKVTYSRNGGSVDIGPEPGTYYVNRITDSTLYLYDTAANAITGSGTGRQDLTSSGSETHHLDPIRYVPASATGSIGVGAFSTQITMVTDDIATG